MSQNRRERRRLQRELKKVDPNNVTKKIYLYSNTNKKTIKKRYKD